MDLIPATADCPQEGPAHTTTTVPPPPRNTRDNLEALAEAPTTPRAPATSRQAIKTNADLNTRTSHTALLPLRNTRNDPEAPLTASKAAARIKANPATGTDGRITPQTE